MKSEKDEKRFIVKQIFYIIMFLIVVLVTPSCATLKQNMNKQLTDKEKLYGLSLLWKEASYNFAFFDQVPNLDFDFAYQNYISKVLETTNTFNYYEVLCEFIALLKDGHTEVYMPENLANKYVDFPPIYTREAQHEAIITMVDKKLETEIPLGSLVLAVDEIPIKKVLKEKVFPKISSSTEHILWSKAIRGNGYNGYGLLAGQPNSEVVLTIKKPNGKIKKIHLIRNRNSRNIDWKQNQNVESGNNLFEFKLLENKIVYLKLNSFNNKKIIDDFKLVYNKIKTAKGLIIDLRFNGGGNTGIGSEILSYFTTNNLHGSIWKTRKHVAAYSVWGEFYDKYKNYFLGNEWETGEHPVLIADKKDSLIVPTIVLIGRDTASAAEDFLIYAEKLEHFTTLGELTFGSTGQPIMLDLPAGGSARICAKRDTYPDGKDFVGYGIKPDIIVERTAEYYLSDNDFQLKKAIKVIQKQIK